MTVTEAVASFCGMAIGYRDADASINTFTVPRVPLAKTVAFEGF